MQSFDEKTVSFIKQWDQTLKKQVEIRLITADHAEDTQFINFSEKLTHMVSGVVIETEKGEKDLPFFQLKRNISYSALPLAKELAPFCETLSQIADPDEIKLFSSTVKDLQQVDIPVNLKLYIALECPHCPDAVRSVMSLAMMCENIHLHIIDGTLFPESAQGDEVMSAPCLLLDDDFRWTGSVSVREIIKMIIDRDPSQLSPATLKNIIEQGDASWIAGQMLEKQKLFDGFIKLLLNETWSVRLGAMVIVEELAETDPEFAAKLCPVLMEEFDKKDVPIQGDILYILGETGNFETGRWIRNKFEEFKHQDIIDAASEALDTLKL